MYNMPNKHSVLLVKWLGTLLCLVGIALTSFNVYPLNILFGFVGSGLWTMAGILQNDAPLVLVEAVATVIYLAGLVVYFIHVLYSWGIL
jgi:hypothetical protein